ncbi:MlaD family protein [Novosphingobium sp.]|uniref:MlaD family protein n=1 Tax=Novosphingobium sp. TaxID=1874826 RepID=UPI0027347D9D|nr:MlaD family protein [Novosphingobium sp.]MDP3905815.1 MlaD family protein [Novosphingobium sp.]
METRANHVWVGAVTLLLIALLAAFVIWIARLGQTNQQEYDVFFKQSVDGLSKGSAVNFSGVPVGQVKTIELWKKDPSFVRVRISLGNDVPVLLGTTASIQSGFTGVSNIQLEGAVRGAPPLTEKGPEGVPVIPTKRGGLGELLNSAPVLLERLATLTERMTMVFSDKNQESIENILANTDRVTGQLANASPELQRTLVELQGTLQDARVALKSFEQVAANTDATINGDGKQMLQQFRVSLKSIEKTSETLNATLGDVRPAARQLNDTTLPQAEAAIRDLRATTRALRDLTEKVNDQGAAALLGGDKLPEYKP